MYQKKNRTILILLFFALIVGVIYGLTWANLRFVKENPGGHELLTNWIGFRDVISEGGNPYSDETARLIETESGKIAPSHLSNSYRFTTPLYGIVLYAPIALIPDFEIARAIWMTLTQLAIIGFAFLSLRLMRVRFTFTGITILVLVALFWFHGVTVLLSGNDAIFVGLFLLISIWAITQKEDEFAGVLLAFSTLKPQLIFLVLVFVLIWAATRGRHKIILWFGVTMVFLIATTLLLQSNWIIQNLRAAITAVRENPVYNPASALVSLLPGIGLQVGWIISVLALVGLIIEWFKFRTDSYQAFLWVIMLTLTVTFLSGIPSGYGSYIILFPVFPLLISLAGEKWGVTGKLWGWLLTVVIVGLEWLFYAFTRQTENQLAYLFLPIPIMLVLVLYWMRNWAFNTLRPWFDLLDEETPKKR